MAKQRIAILGGGVAGLSAAYHLSRSADLRNRFDVTVYQMGWRLGGKIASGRDADGRSIEHGLHVWFGCYDNTFRMLQEAYAARPAGARFRHWTDAVKPQPFTPIGVDTGSGWVYWPVTWPSNAAVPGQGGLTLTMWQMIARIAELLRQTVEDLGLDFPLAAPPATGFGGFFKRMAGAVAGFFSGGKSPGDALASLVTGIADPGFLDAIRASGLWADALDTGPDGKSPARPEAIVELLGLVNRSFTAGPLVVAGKGDAAAIFVRDLLDIGTAFVTGLVEDVLKPDRPFAALDENGLEFRDWLVRHGADRKVVTESSIVRALYDTAFQYVDGDQSKPSYAAGTAVGVLVRLIATYKGDMLWEIQSGIGEAVIAPLYELLLAAGVRFRFFRKVTRLELSADGARIDRVHIARQADVAAGEYRPTFDVGGLACWGAQPDWGQLVGGAQLESNGVDFESHWDDTRVAQEVLQEGTDFDGVVLAISMGAYKPLNADPGMCDELIAASATFRDYVDNVPVVPTMSVQLWCDVATPALGWTMRKPAAVAGPGPLNVWADMSQVLTFEPWTHVANKPASLHYLCGTFATQAHKAPAASVGTPAAAKAALHSAVVAWLDDAAQASWPAARAGTGFGWGMLTDPAGGAGPARLAAQYVRVNINPTECCTGSPAGTTQFRPGPTDHGFANLFLAGEGGRSGCNTSSVEGAVMTGMAAARAISGDPLGIVGYAFLTTPPSQFILQE